MQSASPAALLTPARLRSVLESLLPPIHHPGIDISAGDGSASEVGATVIEVSNWQNGGLRAAALVALLNDRLLGMLDASSASAGAQVAHRFTRPPTIVFVVVTAPPPPATPPLMLPPAAALTAQSAQSAQGSQDNGAGGLIAVFASIFAVAVLALLGYWLWRRRRSRDTGKPALKWLNDKAGASGAEEARKASDSVSAAMEEGSPEVSSRRPSFATLPTAREQAKLMMAMGALQALMLADSPEELEQAIQSASNVSGVPAEAIALARQQLELRLQGNAAGSAAATAEMDERMRGLVADLRAKMDMLASLQLKLETIKMEKADLEQENILLRAANDSRAAASLEDEDGQAAEDRMAREAYEAAKAAVMAALAEGCTPTAAQYLERDVHLHRLGDADLRKEYVTLGELYLQRDTPTNTRGMVEMMLIKLGEIVDQPQSKRTKLIERQAEEARQARASRVSQQAKSLEERAEQQRQAEMNEAAYQECKGRWEQLTMAMMAGSPKLTDTARALAKRLAHRQELRLVTSNAEDMRKMPPGSFVAMGTSGLEPTEQRAVLHALVVAAPQGAAAQRFKAMLQEKVFELPDYAITPWDPFENASEDAPLGFASGRGTTGSSKKRLSVSKHTAPQPSAPAPPPPPVPPPPPPAPPTSATSRRSSQRGSQSDSHSAMLDEIVRAASRRSCSAAAAAQEEGAGGSSRL
jgi:hypothetical protein